MSIRMEYNKKLNPRNLEPHFTKHLLAMTQEDLHEKSDIAVQLAIRDQRLEQLTQRIDMLEVMILDIIDEVLQPDRMQEATEWLNRIKIDLERSRKNLDE